MNPVTEDIKDMLEADSNLSFVLGTDLFIGRMPATPNNCVLLLDTPGYPPMVTLTPGEDYFYDSFQVRVRHSNYLTGYQWCKDIQLSLHVRAQKTWSETLYSVIYCSSGPAMLEWDENNRVIFILNFETQRR